MDLLRIHSLTDDQHYKKKSIRKLQAWIYQVKTPTQYTDPNIQTKSNTHRSVISSD
jgi:hypothetical protein